MGETTLSKKHSVTDVLYLLLILVFLLAVCFGFTKDKKSNPIDTISMESCWKDESGASVNLNKLPIGKYVTLTADLDSLEWSGRQFCLKSVDTVFTVYADGEPVYSYHPTQPKLLGESYGMYLLMCYTKRAVDKHPKIWYNRK